MGICSSAQVTSGVAYGEKPQGADTQVTQEPGPPEFRGNQHGAGVTLGNVGQCLENVRCITDICCTNEEIPNLLVGKLRTHGRAGV